MWVQISSGKGPDECELAVSLFLKAYQYECSKNKIKTTIIDVVPGHIKGNMESVLLSVEHPENSSMVPGTNNTHSQAFAHQARSKDVQSIQPEQTTHELTDGTILWICQSPYRPHHMRKNWFIDVEVFKSIDQLSFSDRDVRFETMRSSGPGGQNVNKVETAVRALHIPTGLTVTASEERSQYMNKKLALSKLSNLIDEKNAENDLSHKRQMWLQHNTLERGNPFRVYEGKAFKMKGKSNP